MSNSMNMRRRYSNKHRKHQRHLIEILIHQENIKAAMRATSETAIPGSATGTARDQDAAKGHNFYPKE